MTDPTEILTALYERFNARDLEAVLAHMHEDVLWANGMEGGHVHRPSGIGEYWTRQWAVLDPHVEPVSFAIGPDNQVTVEVHQVVRDLSGRLLVDQMVGHVFQFDGALVKRFDIRGAEAESPVAPPLGNSL